MAAKTSKNVRSSGPVEACGPKSAKTPEESPHAVEVLGLRTKLQVEGSRWQRALQIAQLQRGRVARWQLLEAGLTYDVIQRLVKRHRLHPLPGGVFAVGHLAPAEWADETAALLAVSDGAALSHRTAGAVWGMCGRDAERIHVVVPERLRPRTRSVRIHRARRLAPQDLRVRNGLPVTSPPRTLLGLTGELTPRQLELAYDRALVERIMSHSDVADLLSRARGSGGIPLLRALYEHQRSPTLTRSQAEEQFLELVRAARLPEPRVNARVCGFEVDFLWPEERVIVEIDGFQFHGTRRRFEGDHAKTMILTGEGYEVLRFTARQVGQERLALIALVAGSLAERAPRIEAAG